MFLLLVFATLAAHAAEEIRYESIWIDESTPPVTPSEYEGRRYWRAPLATNETAEIVSWTWAGIKAYGGEIYRTGADGQIAGEPVPAVVGTVAAGPAVLQIYARLSNAINPPRQFYAVVRRVKVVKELPPGELAVIPAGMAARVSLESSTNLHTWVTLGSTNIPAGSVNQFFRIRLDR
ncbi:MAG: hypothetical protein AAB368_13985 [bacterium]